MGQLELEFGFVIKRRPLALASEPSVEFDVGGILVISVRLFVEQHHDQPPEPHVAVEFVLGLVQLIVQIVHLDHIARWFRLVRPLVGKLMVNAALMPRRHLNSKV